MRTPLKRIVGCLVVAALVLVPMGATALAQDPVQAIEPSGESMAVDLLVVRPLGILSVVAGTAVYLVSLPFSAMGGNMDKAGEKLVKEPAKFAFARKLGDI